MTPIAKILKSRLMEQCPMCPGCGMRMRMMQGNCPGCGAGYGLEMGAKESSVSEAVKVKKINTIIKTDKDLEDLTKSGKEDTSAEAPKYKVDLQNTSDYKLDKRGRKTKAHNIVFSKGEDDANKKVNENMKTTYKDFTNKYVISNNTNESTVPENMKSKQKPYVSSDGKGGHEVLGNDGQVKATFTHKEHGKEARSKAQAHLKQHYDDYMKEERTKVKDPKTGKVVSWKDTGDWKKSTHKDGQGKVTHLSDKARRETEKMAKEEVELDEAEKEASFTGSHQGKTTIKHIKNPTVQQRMLAHDIKPGIAGYRDRIDLLKDAKRSSKMKKEEVMEIDEVSAFDWKNPAYKEAEKGKTKTSTFHNIKKISTGTVYTKQFDKDGTSKGTGGDAAAKAENAPKRGRGRPKKDKFAESVEILMSLSEEQFDEMMEEGFDVFFEEFEQLDELSKDTLKSYVKKAAHSAVNKGAEFGSRHAAADEVDRFTNRHMSDKFANQDKMKAMVGASRKEVQAPLDKANKRVGGIKQAVDKLTK